jgi:hypothetical protein
MHRPARSSLIPMVRRGAASEQVVRYPERKIPAYLSGKLEFFPDRLSFSDAFLPHARFNCLKHVR